MRLLKVPLTLALLWVLAAWPLFQYGPPLQIDVITDGPNHLYRFALLDWHVQHGDFYPRWFSDLHYGFGAPVLYFYAPLSYYVLLGLHLFIDAYPTVFQWGFILALAVAITGMFTWAREQFNSEAAGLTAASAYTFTPYIYFSILERAAYPELWGLALTPWVFGLTLRMFRKPGRHIWIAFVLAYAALILTHNLSALLFTPVLLGYAIVLIAPGLRGRSARYNLSQLLTLASPFIHAIGLSSFFLLPFLVETRLVQLERTRDYDYAANFSPAADLFSLPVAFDPQHVSHPYPVSVPWPQLLMAATAVALMFLRPRSSNPRALTLLFAGLAVVCIFLNLRLSLPVWNILPLATTIQFPFRLLGPAMLLLAWLGAALTAQSNKRVQPWLAAGSLSFFFYILTWTYHVPFDSFPETIRPTDIVRDEIAYPARFGTTNLGEFLPRWVKEVPPPDTLIGRYQLSDNPSRLAPIPATVEIRSEINALTASELMYESNHPFTATYYIFYFPGWVATLDNAPLPIKISDPHGLIQLDLPAGQHTLRLARQPTGSIVVGNLLTLLAFIVFALPFRIPKPASTSQQTPGAPIANWTWVVLAGLLVLRASLFEQAESPFFRSSLRYVSHPRSVDFDGQLQLLGFDLPQGDTLVAGNFLPIRLYWQAMVPLSTDYHTTIQLVDNWGNRFGQSDSQHPAGVPTSHWRTGQYARDDHQLLSLIGTPPGEYRLLVSAYGDAPLAVRDNSGTQLGLTYELGTITIERGRPAPAGDLRLIESSLAVQTAAVGDPLPFTLVWSAGPSPQPDLSAKISLRDEQGRTLSFTRIAPAGPSYPSEQWSPNEVIRYPHTINLPADLPAGFVHLVLTFVDANDVPVSEEFSLGHVTITVPERSFSIPPMSVRVDYDFKERIRLLGYDLASDRITLYWQALAPVPVALTVFIHNLDSDGKLVNGQDAPPNRPTTGWLTGEVITDIRMFSVDKRFAIGLYDPTTNERFGEAYSNQP